MKILDTHKISSLSIKVSENIHKKNLLKFLRTSILNSSLCYTKNSFFYYTYIPSSSTYEIILYEKLSKKTLLEPFLLNHFATADCENIIYVTDTYFVVFMDDELKLLKFISNTTQEDISIYMEQIYGFKDFRFVCLACNDLQVLKEKACTFQNTIVDVPLYENKTFQGFLGFCGISFFLVIGFFILHIYTLNQTYIQSSSISANQNIIHLNKPLQKITKLFSYIQSSALYIEKITFKNNKISTVLYDTKKENLLKIVKKYKHKLKIKSMKYNDEKKLYSMDVIIAY